LKDLIVVISLIVAFALLITAHVAITYGLVRRAPRWRAPIAFFVVPLAPYWAWREKMKVRAGIWTGALVLYMVATVVASL
jgi:hypothetical protein